MTITSRNNSYQFSVSKVMSDRFFSEWLQAIVDTWNTGATSYLKADMEAEGFLHIVLYNYPNGSVRMDFYRDTDFNIYDNEFEEQPLPVPVFTTVTAHYYLVKEVLKALEVYKSKDFYCFTYSAKEIEELEKLMK